ncbi:hypothetical protein D3C86_1090010 [compost metagenome]
MNTARMRRQIQFSESLYLCPKHPMIARIDLEEAHRIGNTLEMRNITEFERD